MQLSQHTTQKIVVYSTKDECIQLLKMLSGLGTSAFDDNTFHITAPSFADSFLPRVQIHGTIEQNENSTTLMVWVSNAIGAKEIILSSAIIGLAVITYVTEVLKTDWGLPDGYSKVFWLVRALVFLVAIMTPVAYCFARYWQQRYLFQILERASSISRYRLEEQSKRKQLDSAPAAEEHPGGT